MPDYEYLDEAGNPIDPDSLDGDYEIVEEIDEVVDGPTAAAPAPAAQQPAAGGGGLPAPRMSKAVIAIGAAVVLGVGGVVAYGLSAIGGQNTISDVKGGVAAKSESVKARVEKRTKPEIDACDGKQLRDTAWSGSSEPSKQLVVTSSVDLGGPFSRALDAAGTLASTQTHILQLGAEEMGVYTQIPRERGEAESWQVVKVDTAGDQLRIISDAVGHGGDVDAAGACAQAAGGVYRVTGDGVPASARGLREGQVELLVLKPDATDQDVVWAVAGDSLLQMELQYAPEDDEQE